MAVYSCTNRLVHCVLYGHSASGIHSTERAAVISINGQIVSMGFCGLYQANCQTNSTRGGTAEFTINQGGAVSQVVKLAVLP